MNLQEQEQFYQMMTRLGTSRTVANVSIVDIVYKSHYRAYESIIDYD